MSSALDAQDILDFDIELPTGWFSMPFAESPDAAGWPRSLAASFSLDTAATDGIARLLKAIQGIVAEEDPADATDTRVYIPLPQTGIVNGFMTCRLLWLDSDDSPESYLAEVDAHADDRSPGYEIRGYQSWRAPHQQGELVGFTHLTALADSAEEDPEAILEQRVAFGIFPVGAAQMVQLVFRSAFVGGFDDMVTEAQAIADTLRVSLGAAA
ncbi:MAG TPA: hypothetical protein VIJ18_00820 [Microbacteriaceae bacterium]